MLFAALTHLKEGLSLEAPLAVYVEKYLMCLVGTRRSTVFIKEQQSALFLITLIKNKASIIIIFMECILLCISTIYWTLFTVKHNNKYINSNSLTHIPMCITECIDYTIFAACGNTPKKNRPTQTRIRV
jgi:hypothetical protein